MSSSPSPSRFGSVSLDSYQVEISINTWKTEWTKDIKRLGKDASKYILITDSNLDLLYGSTLRDLLVQNGMTVHYKVLPPGEQAKCRETKAEIEDWMFSHNCGRDTVMLALGGGVIGDLVGYVASGYMRGIPFIQLPTSFLAMVDSSIGGKTGIDTPAGKNLLGAFHRPLAVLIDLQLLLTLPQRELCNGMAESIKAGIIWSLPLFELMESNVDGLLKKKDLNLLAQVVQQSVAIKAHVVLNDEKEAGMRSILNFGHSIGHAIEALMQPELLHGECVAIGMIEEIILARGYGLVGSGELRRVDNVLKSFSLPTKVPPHLTTRALLEKMAIDKKNKNGKKELVLITAIGSVKSHPKYTTMIPDADLELLLNPSIGVEPVTQPVTGHVSVPGSKSLSNRILLLAALGRGPCKITGLLHSQDTQVMIDSLRELGIQFEWVNGLEELLITGCEGKIHQPRQSLYLGNAGTASRFLTSVACLLKDGTITLTGNARMHERPIGDLVDSLRRCGPQIDYVGKNQGCLPLRIAGNGTGLKGGEVTLAANISSQYVSSILLAAPYAADADLELRLETSAGKKVVSKPFITMTIELMKRFGVKVDERDGYIFRVERGGWTNPSQFQVEGDASSATYPLALAAITGGTITVDNVGSESLQGDSKFYTVLEAMGCKVSQTATTTTVQGPDWRKGEKLNAVDMDMDAMTDTFMTLAAVAVFAEGTTRITNIANQRVKECNRIAVMVSELSKLGIEVRESETGLDIVGLGLEPECLQRAQSHIASTSHQAVVIECHDDHRIAMSFALIGTRLRGIILDEKRCVDKTYPEFWEHLGQKFGVQVYPPKEGIVELHHASSAKPASASSSSSNHLRDSIVFIGMRGSGKTHLGEAVARDLGRTFFDLDAILEQRLGGSIRGFVESDGWEKFREKELEVLKDMLAKHGQDAVIACGGGVVETPAAVAELKKHRFVIQIRRDIEDVIKYLDSDATRPTFDARAAWSKRQPLYIESSSFEFVIAPRDENWSAIQEDCCRFVRALVEPKALTVSKNTFFLSLTLADLTAYDPIQFSSLTQGADAIEIRVDLISESEDDDKTRNYIAQVRRLSSLPLIYTVRSRKQGGNFIGYDENEVPMLNRLSLGFRLACQAVDVEAALTANTRSKLFEMRQRQPSTRLIMSHHEPTSNGGTKEQLRQQFERLLRACDTTRRGHDILKLVVLASDEYDAIRLIEVAREFESSVLATGSAAGVISLAMGSAGRLSRVINQVLTPVTHERLPTAAAPGQLSVEKIMNIRASLGVYPFNAQPTSAKKHWLLFGSPITYSPSPILHNAAFRFMNLSNVFSYGKLDTSSVEAVKGELMKPEFGGGNVTIPLKEECCALVQSQSEAVRAIGALNTIIRRSDGSFHGENTDWQGIHLLLTSHHGRPSSCKDVGIVIGAGGTARAAIYALQQSGFSNNRILVFNPRTKEKAETLAKHFGVTPLFTLTRSAIASTTNLPEFTIRTIVSTIPGSVGLTIEDGQLLDSQTEKPTVMDASYIPSSTAFLLQCQTQFQVPPNQILRGIDLLIAQGWFGMESWMGKSLTQDCKEEMAKEAREFAKLTETNTRNQSTQK